MRRPSIRSFFNNFNEYDAPFATKVQLAIRNNSIKIRRGSACCGHHGEPGC
ncbi:MAG: hypothetical protein ACRDKZ_06405 [Actinomycetota bacterium]